MSVDSQPSGLFGIRRKFVNRKPLQIGPNTVAHPEIRPTAEFQGAQAFALITAWPTGAVFATDRLRIAASIVVNGIHTEVLEAGNSTLFVLSDYLEPLRLLVFGELNDGEIEVFDFRTDDAVAIDVERFRQATPPADVAPIGSIL